MTQKKRILIGIPAFDGIVAEAQESLFSMVYRAGRDLPEYDFAIHIGYKKEQFRARNSIVNAAISWGCDYLLMLDDDMIVPHNLIERLLAHDKDVVGALYYQRGGLYHPVVMEWNTKEEGVFNAHFLNLQDPRITTERGLHQVGVIGGGCMLFKTSVFDRVLPPYFEYERVVGTDIAICGRLRDAGYDIYCDTSIELGHVGEKKVITSRSVPIFERAMAKVTHELTEDVKAYFGMGDEELAHAMDRAAGKEARQAAWGDRTDSWEDVAQYYRDNKDWQVLNLAYFNIYKRDIYKEWGVVQGLAMLKPGDRVLDYGAGLGHLSVPLAQHGCGVYAIDIADSPTQEFVKWRKSRHNLGGLHLRPLSGELPDRSFLSKVDGAFCISVMDHLTKPYETIEWIRDQLKPGAFFVCEYNLGSGEDEPQHLDRYDVATFQQFMHGLGFSTSPEYDWLFFYEGV